jgi:hypothetical protein
VVIETLSAASEGTGDEGAEPGVLSVMSSGFGEGFDGVMDVPEEFALRVAVEVAEAEEGADLASGMFWLVFRKCRFGMGDRSANIFLSAARRAGKPGKDIEGESRRLAPRASKS